MSLFRMSGENLSIQKKNDLRTKAEIENMGKRGCTLPTNPYPINDLKVMKKFEQKRSSSCNWKAFLL